MKSKPRQRQNTNQATSKTGSNRLRIIGGQWRGRKLDFAAVEGLRPTGDRIRETLFNWLQADLPGAHCLDLFSGSGALGLEALSRGVASAVLLEKNATAAQQIQSNLTLLGSDAGQVLQRDTLSHLQHPPPRPYQVVFLDPPFALNLWQTVIDSLETHDWLDDGAAIYIETPKNQSLVIPSHWQLHRQKHSGQISYSLYYRHLPD
ncbi:MAG: 16S rRNA (guanine(966)-N(2))-methyltransferase [Candidatus Pelagadaptatus aseana]|uniref:16S rRNA (guanine(966)-N(2))-methyltransferase RsmD n=1 Tax=Candidatus Pelagadaptatus aseana TaxID=3120508 RepID=UPI0039B2992B